MCKCVIMMCAVRSVWRDENVFVLYYIMCTTRVSTCEPMVWKYFLERKTETLGQVHVVNRHAQRVVQRVRLFVYYYHYNNVHWETLNARFTFVNIWPLPSWKYFNTTCILIKLVARLFYYHNLIAPRWPTENVFYSFA